MPPTYFQLPDVEPIIAYSPGGLHPVHLGDTFCNGRYEVVRKLGAGSSATVWLVQDHTEGGFAALKIFRADSDGREIEIMRRLHNSSGAYEHVMRVLHLFEHVGPNGTHQCIVTEVLGPSLAAAQDDLEDVYDPATYPPQVAQSISFQIAQGLRELHSTGIVHGDLTKSNVLLCSPFFASWSSLADVDEYMTEPQTRPIRLYNRDIAPPSPHRPAYTVIGLLSTRMTLACFPDPQNVRVKLCDFGEAFLCPSDPGATVSRSLGIPLAYASPEVLLKQPVGPPADVWALAVIVHDLIAMGCPLFAPIKEVSLDDVLSGMVLRKGRLPERLWVLWEQRRTFFDDAGGWVRSPSDIPAGIQPGALISEYAAEDRCGDVSAFQKMISAMTEYDPERRASVQEVLLLMSAVWPGVHASVAGG